MYDNETFIRTFDNVIDPETFRFVSTVCSQMGQRIRKRPSASDPLANMAAGTHTRNNGTVVDSQLQLEPFAPMEANTISDAVFTKMLSRYMKEFYLIKDLDADWINGCTLLQKTEIGGGYHKLHTESTGYYNTSRTLAWMIYLNDVEDGGETEFPHQRMKIKPKENMGVIWPGGVTHFHRGNPPYSNEKFILTGWLLTSGDVTTYHMRSQGRPGHRESREV